MSAPLVGIFVGGAARRMQGAPKGLLPTADGEAIVVRLARVAREALGEPRVVLVGVTPAYAALGFESVADDPSGIGPLGGLRALLADALQHASPAAFAFGGDMPYVSASLIARLASHAPEAAALAPRPDRIWQPLFARYAPAAALQAIERVLAGERRALHAVFETLGPHAQELPLREGELALLHDWDTPRDLVR